MTLGRGDRAQLKKAATHIDNTMMTVVEIFDQRGMSDCWFQKDEEND